MRRQRHWRRPVDRSKIAPVDHSLSSHPDPCNAADLFAGAFAGAGAGASSPGVSRRRRCMYRDKEPGAGGGTGPGTRHRHRIICKSSRLLGTMSTFRIGSLETPRPGSLPDLLAGREETVRTVRMRNRCRKRCKRRKRNASSIAVAGIQDRDPVQELGQQKGRRFYYVTKQWQHRRVPRCEKSNQLSQSCLGWFCVLAKSRAHRDTRTHILALMQIVATFGAPGK